MQFLIYILVYPLLWLISILPFKLLYFVSDGVYILLYHIIGYRKKVVNSNLKLVFPKVFAWKTEGLDPRGPGPGPWALYTSLWALAPWALYMGVLWPYYPLVWPYDALVWPYFPCVHPNHRAALQRIRQAIFQLNLAGYRSQFLADRGMATSRHETFEAKQ